MIVKYLLNPQKVDMIPTRNGYGEGLVLLGKDPRVVVLCADLSESTRSQAFQKAYPERFVEVGVAEQNLASLAAGLALEGKIPFISSYAMFSPGRNWEQIRTTIAYNAVPVKIAGAHAGVSVGPDGATHQAIEDMAIMRCIPSMTVLCPCDVHETRKATIAAAKIDGPVYLRFAREKTAVMTTKTHPFVVGKAQVWKKGSDVTIVGCGPVLYEVWKAAHALYKQGISVEVINMSTIKPLDQKTLIASVKKTRCVVTVEEHQVIGGLGSGVAECLGKHLPVPLEMIGVQDRFGESGSPEELWRACGLTEPFIMKAALKVIRRKKKYV